MLKPNLLLYANSPDTAPKLGSWDCCNSLRRVSRAVFGAYSLPTLYWGVGPSFLSWRPTRTIEAWATWSMPKEISKTHMFRQLTTASWQACLMRNSERSTCEETEGKEFVFRTSKFHFSRTSLAQEIHLQFSIVASMSILRGSLTPKLCSQAITTVEDVRQVLRKSGWKQIAT